MAKEKLPTLVSPAGIAAYAWLAEPDTGKKYSDDKYKVTLVLNPEDEGVTEFLAKVEAAHERARGKKKTDSPVKDGNDKKDAEGKPKEEFKNKKLLTFKSKFQPQLLEKGVEGSLPNDRSPRSGDVIRVAFAMLPYEEGKNAGISLQMRAVKVVERRARADYSDAFGDNEGGEAGGDAPAKGDAGGGDAKDF